MSSSQNNPYAPGASPIAGAERIVGEVASAGRRFWTFVIDYIVIRTTFFVGEVSYLAVYGELAYYEASSTLWFLAFVLLYVSYYIALEFTFGRTLGKALLGTRVVTASGSIPSFGSVVVRTLCRLIPLEPVSFTLADTWWHDSLSKTTVLRIRRAS